MGLKILKKAVKLPEGADWFVWDEFKVEEKPKSDPQKPDFVKILRLDKLK